MRVGRTWKEDGEDEESEESVPTGWRRPTHWYVDWTIASVECVLGRLASEYAWIDLAAGPSRWAATAGDGDPGSIPRCTSSSAGPDSNPVPVVKRGGFASRLATTVWRTVQHLFLPSLARLPNMLVWKRKGKLSPSDHHQYQRNCRRCGLARWRHRLFV